METEMIAVDLDGVTIQVEVLEANRMKIGTKDILKLDTLAESITKISKSVSEAVREAKPQKAIVKYGLSVGIEQGSLVAALVRGTGSANLEITLEWEATSKKAENI